MSLECIQRERKHDNRRSEFQTTSRGKTQKKEEKFIASTVRLGQSPLVTDSSASKATAPASREVLIRQRNLSLDYRGLVTMDAHDSHWIGALRPNSESAEINSFYYALQWIQPATTMVDARRVYNTFTYSQYSVRLFVDDSIKGRCNKYLIKKVRSWVLEKLKLHHYNHNRSIGWANAHPDDSTSQALGNALADRLAASGSSGSTSFALLEQELPTHRRVPNTAFICRSLPRHESRWRPNSVRRDPRRHPALDVAQSLPDKRAMLHLLLSLSPCCTLTLFTFLQCAK